MANLYEIDSRLRELENFVYDDACPKNLVNVETGEIISEEEFFNMFNNIQMALTDKIENTMCYYKNLMSDVEAFKAEEEKLKKRRIAKETYAEKLKQYINNYIMSLHIDEKGVLNKEELNKWKMETPKIKLSYRKSESVNITNENAIPNEYKKEKVEISVDKTALKKDIKSGKIIDGAEIVVNINMQVK